MTNEVKLSVLQALPPLKVGDTIQLPDGDYYVENIMQSLMDASEPPTLKFFLTLRLIQAKPNLEEN